LSYIKYIGLLQLNRGWSSASTILVSARRWSIQCFQGGVNEPKLWCGWLNWLCTHF